MAATGLSESDLAWLAGFIDGEGCIRFMKGQRASKKEPDGFRIYPTVAITQKDPTELYRIKMYYGGYLYEKGKSISGKTVCRLHMTCRTAERFLKDIVPFLRIKKRQAELCIEYYTHFSVGKRITERGGKVRLELLEEMNNENHKFLEFNPAIGE